MEKIYVITNPMPLHNNSPAVSLGKFVQVICAAGYSPEIIGARLPEDGIPGVPADVPVRSYKYGGSGIFKMLSFVFLQVRMFFSGIFKYRKGDEVYFWIADKMIGAFLSARLKGASTNYFLYGRTFKDGEGGISAKLIMFMMNRATRVCAEAPSVFSQWEPQDSVPRASIRLFVPKSEVKPVPFDDRRKIVAMFSRLSPGKHIDDSVRAFCRVHDVLPEYSMIIIGGGVLEDETRTLINELGAAEYISVTGWLRLHDAKTRIADCRVLLYPTDAEGVPGGILEAMSLGVPALASPAGGIPDVIEDGVDGRILSGTDPETISAELLALLNAKELSRMSEAAMKKIAEQYSLESAAANFKAVKEYRKLKD